MKLNKFQGALLLLFLIFSSCLVPFKSFKNTRVPSPPDYTKERYWASLPTIKDSADFQLPEYGIIDGQKTAKADVFFIPPTNYINGLKWNQSVDKEFPRELTQKIGCKLQASVFNESCRIYAPHYRTAILYSYFALRKKNAQLAFALAYEDVKKAFIYYLENYNKGRPLVIASHSQGTDYAVKLLQDFFDKDTVLKKRLVAAYLIGRPIYDTTFKQIRLMSSAEQTGGYVTWNSVSYYTNSFYGDRVGKIVGVNPLSWKSDTVYVSKKENKGALPFTAKKIDSTLVDAIVAPSGFLWIHPPLKMLQHYPGINTPFYHKNDYGFFYMNIRENVKLRVDAYLKKHR